MSRELTVSESVPKIIVTQAQTNLSITPVETERMVVTPDGGGVISLEPVIQNLMIANRVSETLTITNGSAQILVLSEVGTGGNSGPYGQPYYQSEDEQFYYFSWQHRDGMQWEAQRFDNTSFQIITINGTNPQPATLTDFQNLSF